jgi:hypothetical protein
MTFSNNAVISSDDPAIQFIGSGGRSINFTISAGQTQAVFSGGLSSFQPGTVAGNITFSARFLVGSTDITPTPIPSALATVQRQVPTITSLTATISGSGFTVTAVGFSTPREVTRAVFTFTGSSGLQTSNLSLDVSSAFQAWYQGQESQQNGSRFQVSVAFIVQGDVSAITSVSMTLTNNTGTSSSSSATLR